jgi:CRP-like cAMP-binding protein
MSQLTQPTQNLLLGAIPQADWLRWQAHLEWADMPKGMMLAESGHVTPHVYFPTTAIASRMYITQSGNPFELAVIGREGMTGTGLLMGKGCESTPAHSVVTHAGEGYRLKPQVLMDTLSQSPIVLHMILRYTQTLITQVAQQAVCNRHHSLDQRLCQWLLKRLDRLDGNEIQTTHEAIAHMLGVRREGVTAAALVLQRNGMISYARGRIQVLERIGLEDRACECYAVVHDEQRRLVWPLSPEQVNKAMVRRSTHASCTLSRMGLPARSRHAASERKPVL